MQTSSSYFSPYQKSTERTIKPEFDPYSFSKSLEEKNKAASRTQSSSGRSQNGDDSQSWQSALNKAATWTNLRQQGQDSGLSFVGGGGAQSLGDGLSSVYPMIYQQSSGGSGGGGLGSTIGTLAGIGASFIPGLGPGIAAAMPAIGGGIGSIFG